MLFSVLLVAAVAMLDELLQSFNLLRTSSPYDVLLDLAGGATALSLVYLTVGRKPEDG